MCHLDLGPKEHRAALASLEWLLQLVAWPWPWQGQQAAQLEHYLHHLLQLQLLKALVLGLLGPLGQAQPQQLLWDLDLQRGQLTSAC